MNIFFRWLAKVKALGFSVHSVALSRLNFAEEMYKKQANERGHAAALNRLLLGIVFEADELQLEEIEGRKHRR